MTSDEQDRVIVGLVNEKRDLRKLLVCLKNQIRDAKAGLFQGVAAIESAENFTAGEDAGVKENIDYPDSETLKELIIKLKESTNRIAEIDRDLNAC